MPAASSSFAEDGTTELVFADGVVARLPSAIVYDALGRGLDLPALIAATSNAETNLLLAAMLRELIALRQMKEITSELDAGDLSRQALGPS
jgi:hypothetical protein